MKNNKLNPYWITGFAVAESSFSLRITQDKTRKSGWRILLIFSIELHRKDLSLLERIQTFFKIGNIYQHNSCMVYSVQSINKLFSNIIPHFDKYPLLTQKRNDFILFKEAIDLLINKTQNSEEGLQKIINLKASINWGLSKNLLNYFPNTIPFLRPISLSSLEINPNWLTGFTDGEGCFYVKPNFKVNFSISQHIRDEFLLKEIANYLDSGIIEKPNIRSNATIVFYKFKDICNKIIPFFKNYSLQGIKALDFKDFYNIIDILKNKPKLTQEDCKLIQNIKSNMNKKRKF
jgi:hypothetical protein